VIYSELGGEKMSSAEFNNVDSIIEDLVNRYNKRLVETYKEYGVSDKVSGDKGIKIPDPSDLENISLVLTYKNTMNLVKLSESLIEHSKSLNRWTKAITVISGALALVAIAQVVLILVSQ
jgi:hypothetical protein